MTRQSAVVVVNAVNENVCVTVCREAVATEHGVLNSTREVDMF